MYILLVVFLYIICASMFTISKWGLAYAQPIFFMAVRMLFAGFVLGIYALISGSECTKDRNWSGLISRIITDWHLWLQLILFHIYITYICDLCALASLSSVESAFLYNLAPFISALFSYWWFGERMTGKKWLGLALGFCSVMPTLAHAAFISPGLEAYIPRLVTLIAVISSSYGWVLVRDLVKERGYSAVFVNAFSMFFGGLLALVTSLWFENWTTGPVTAWVPFMQSVILLILLANSLFYNLYGFLLKYYTATFLSFAGFLCPLFTALLGWFFLGELLSWSLLLSGICIGIGLYLFYAEELKQGYITTKQ